MKEVNVTELRNNLPAYLSMVKASEELLHPRGWMPALAGMTTCLHAPCQGFFL